MSEECQMPEPQEEHKKLLEAVGNWTTKGKFFMDPSQEPMETTGKEVVEAVGGFWTVGTYESEFMGAPFKGVSKTGYLPAEGCFITTWVDSMMPFIFIMKGNFEADKKTLNFRGDGPNYMTGDGTLPHRIELIFNSKDSHTMSMYAEMPGAGEMKMMEMVYTRA